MEEKHAEYRCSACKKEAKSTVAQCKSCTKLFFHSGCTSKHKVHDKNGELVSCGPFHKFTSESEIERSEMRKVTTGSTRDRVGSTGSIGSLGINMTPSNGYKQEVLPDMDSKLDNIIRAVKEMRDEAVCRKEIKALIKEAVREEIESIKQELIDLRQKIQGSVMSQGEIAGGSTERSYSGIVKEKKKENILIVKPIHEQQSVTTRTKSDIKNKISISELSVGVTSIKDASKGSVVIGCNNLKEREILKENLNRNLGTSYKVHAPEMRRPTFKIL